MARKKVRVTVDYGGQERQLFSASETKGRDVTIMTMTGGQVHHPLLPRGPAKPTKISIHQSPNSDGFRINFTTTMADDLEVSRGVLLKGAKRTGFLCPLYVRMCPRLDEERFAVNGKAADERIRLSSYDPSKSTLAYAVFAAHKILLPLDPLTGYPLQIIGFSDFYVSVIAYLRPTPSLRSGRLSEWVRSVYHGDQPVPEGQPMERDPPTFAEVRHWQELAMVDLATAYAAFAASETGSAPEPGSGAPRIGRFSDK